MYNRCSLEHWDPIHSAYRGTFYTVFAETEAGHIWMEDFDHRSDAIRATIELKSYGMQNVVYKQRNDYPLFDTTTIFNDEFKRALA